MTVDTASQTTIINIIVTAGLTAALLLVNKVYGAVIDWWLVNVRKKPSRQGQAAVSSARMVSRIIELTLETSNLRDKYKSEVRSLVARAVESIVNEQREVARGVVVKGLDTRAAVHDYKCAGEGLKPELVRLYMNVVDNNGFKDKSPIEWQSQQQETFNLMVSRSNEWYDLWYVRTDLPLDLIREGLKQKRSEFIAMNSTLLNAVRDKNAEMEEEKASLENQRAELFDEIADPQGWGKRNADKAKA